MKIMHIEPNHIETIVRILNAKDDVKSNDELVVRLKNIITLKSRQSSPNIEGAYYALGKVYDQNQQFDHAFEFYRLANQLSAKRVNSYDKKKQEHATAQLISHINKQWITENSCTNCISSSPIFICGMFRSGSTLVEKILASHPDVTPGGELNHFYQSIKESGLERLSFTHIHKLQLNTIGQLYSDKLHTFFPDASRVTDKRPDNFLYLGLIKAILPHAKFICTDRDPLDICLSIYFQHLSTSVDYGTELMDIAHYYVEYRKVLSHWQSLIPDSLYVLKYDELVSEPQRVCSEMFSHCGLEWDSQYLNVIGVGNLIKTASLWQVRKPLYKTSSKRWLNYQNNIQKVKIYLDEQLPSCK